MVLKVAIANGWTPVVVSNQSGISKGLYSLESARAFNSELKRTLLQKGLILDHFVFCIHDNFSNCEYRKPGSGMLDLVLNSTQADNFVMFGNSTSDSQAAARAKIIYSDISQTENCLSLLECR
jgi:D-glycero-D-manno-heptose 1,7-bisphosphate phosphatase